MESPTPSRQSAESPATVTPGSGEEERIQDVNEHDVLCGRGGSINSHKGNEHFRNLVEKRKRVYLTARFKREKRLIASSIVSEIRALNGRFLARKGGKDNGYWYDIGDEKARDKTSQALRENAPSIRAEIETEIHEQRAEQRRKEAKDTSPTPPPTSNGYPPPPPPPQHYYQSYWDYYYRYYGYPPPPHPHYGHGPPPSGPPPPGPPPPPPPGPGHSVAGHPPPPPHYWGGHPPPHPPPHAQTPPPQPHESPARIPSSALSPSRSMSHDEDEDQRIAMILQEEERANAYVHEVQKRRHERYALKKKSPRSQFAPPTPTSSGSQMHAEQGAEMHEHQKRHHEHPREDPRDHHDYHNQSTHHARKHARHGSIGPFDGHEHHPHAHTPEVAAAAAAAPEPAKAQTDEALSQEEKDHRLAVLLQEEEDRTIRHRSDGARRNFRSNAYSQAQLVGSGPSLFDQTASAVESFMAWTTSAPAPSDSKPPYVTEASNERVIPGRPDMAYSPINLPPDSNYENEKHTASTAVTQEDPNSSMLSQVAQHILGSWDLSGTIGGLDNSEDRGSYRVRSSNASAMNHHQTHVDVGMDESKQDVEVTREEMPPPEPRVQIDWPSKVGGCHTWLPESLAGGAALFGSTGGSVHHRSGISPVNSLEMDTSHHGSVGGGSLCQVFSGEEDSMRMAIQKIPSWERSMRSKSPLSIGSGDHYRSEEFVRVRQSEKPPLPLPPQHRRDPVQEENDTMDWES